MKFCDVHWAKLREAIERRGLSHLVAKGGEAAAKRMVAELRGTATDRTYDPLMAAHNMIVGEALRCGGLYLLTGEYCPVCEYVTHHPPACKDDPPCTVEQAESFMIDGPADAVLAYCREKGLVLAQ